MNQKMNVAIETYNLKTEIAYPNQSKENICEGIHNNCLSCGYNIVHPLCPSCIAKGFKQWILLFPRDEEKLLRQVNKFLEVHKQFDGKSKKCVACNKYNVHICPRCFTEYLYKITKEAGLGVRALSEFLFIFNFDFEHKGYTKELEVFGGY